jgi:hypothetical protein
MVWRCRRKGGAVGAVLVPTPAAAGECTELLQPSRWDVASVDWSAHGTWIATSVCARVPPYVCMRQGEGRGCMRVCLYMLVCPSMPVCVCVCVCE